MDDPMILKGIAVLEAQAQSLIGSHVRGETSDLEQQALDLKTHALNSLILKLGKALADFA